MMHRLGLRRPSASSPRQTRHTRYLRQPGLRLEPLESRRMLSVASDTTTILPNIASLTTDVSGWGGMGG